MTLSRRRVFAATATVLAAAGGIVAGRSAQARYHDGPVSDHFDGLRFFDGHGASPRSLVDLARRFATRRLSPWPKRVENPRSDVPPRRVDGATWRVTFVGHASLLIQAAGLNILVDPVWSERVSPVSFAGPKRVNDPGIAF